MFTGPYKTLPNWNYLEFELKETITETFKDV